MSKIKLLKRLRELEIVYREPVKLRSGKISDFYCDIKKAYGYPDVLVMLADEIGCKLSKKITCIAASGYGGLPLSAVVATRYDKHLVMVRDTPKKHGTKASLDGYIPTQHDIIAIVDDVLTTGNSLRTTMAGLASTQARIAQAIVVIKRGEATLKVPCIHIFSIDRLINKKQKDHD